MTKSNWEKIKLGDIADVVGGGTPSTKEDSFWNGNVPWLTPKDLSGYNSRYITRGERNISDEGLKNSSATLIPAETVLLTSRAPIGYVAIAKNPISTNQGFKSLVLKKGHYPLFYYYLLKANVEYLRNMGTGSTFKEVSGSVVKGLTFYIPTTFDEQKRIAQILGAFDDKIELLQKQNKTLEDMAKAIFKSWFVDFDIVKAKQQGRPKADIIREYHLTQELYDLFPSDFENSSLGPIPLGWEVKKIHNLAILTMGQSPSGSTYNQNGTGLPFYQGRTDFGFRFPKKRVYCSAPTRIAEIDDILISVRAPVGDINLANEKCCIGRGVASIRSKMSDNSFLYYSMLNIKNQFDVFNTEGTVFGSINKNDLSNISILTPNLQIIKAYNKIASKYDRKIINNTKQIQTLTELRDTLLPRLISGKIKV